MGDLEGRDLVTCESRSTDSYGFWKYHLLSLGEDRQEVEESGNKDTH